MAEQASAGGHSAICLRLMRVFPRVMRGMRRYQDQTTPQTPAALGPRHVAALEQLRDGPLTVGALAARLGLTLSTVSGVLTGLAHAMRRLGSRSWSRPSRMTSRCSRSISGT